MSACVCVFILALTHSCSVHYTSIHMGNNEITEIVLSEKNKKIKKNLLHFHGWCPVHVNSVRRGAKPTLSTHTPLLSLFFLSLSLHLSLWFCLMQKNIYIYLSMCRKMHEKPADVEQGRENDAVVSAISLARRRGQSG